ncbi:uncharacterized protein [Physcomitrium patens]|uniref:DUF7748 domain-containing protein n=1 Tax=Physcomitrium patens TaxID=3218 RepID=A0A2K1L442_PHYPA|nr:hypothetical protein PHYPA_003588 [Physcomitrium patens]
MENKLITRVVNRTKQRLTLRIGLHNRFTKLAVIEIGEEYKVKTGLHWTYQELTLETGIFAKKLVISTDDCFESERITIHDLPGGKLEANKVPRTQVPTSEVERTDSTWDSWFCLPQSLSLNLRFCSQDECR